ncbi:MAG TPA: DapH/DapD/GlmU-related protein [Actinomycetota bacterium]|nr:DapH/DapD/GlmU-related protein [Actinomycetota bacterium]
MAFDVVRRGAVEVAPGVVAGAGCLVGGPDAPVSLRESVVLGDYVKVGGGVDVGERSRIGDFVHLGHPTKREVRGSDPTAGLPRAAGFVVAEPVVTLGAGAVVRSHSVVYLHVRIGPGLSTGHHAVIREHTTIGSNCVFGTYASSDGYNSIGDDVHVGQYAQLSQGLRVGHGSFVGGHTVFSDNRMAVRDPKQDLVGAVVGDFVRIGLGCVVLPGVTIGDDALVGAGSVVSSDVPPGVVAFGSPCRVVRDLTPEEIRDYRESVRSPA